MDLSIVIINHNTRKLTTQAVEAIFLSRPNIEFEIIIVDNSDNPDEYFSTDLNGVKIVSHVENKGFSHGCNIGAMEAQGEYILFLNSDTVMQEHTLDESVWYLRRNSQVGILGVQVILQNGELDHACKRGFPTPWNAFCYFLHLDKLFPKTPLMNGYCLGHLDNDKIQNVDAVTGAYLMISAKLYQQVQGFDETFFMYGEDLDLCWRVKAAGYQVVYYPFVSCIHLKGQSGKAAQNPVVKYHFYNSMLIFYDRYYQERYPRWVTGMVKWVIRRKMPVFMGEAV